MNSGLFKPLGAPGDASCGLRVERGGFLPPRVGGARRGAALSAPVIVTGKDQSLASSDPIEATSAENWAPGVGAVTVRRRERPDASSTHLVGSDGVKLTRSLYAAAPGAASHLTMAWHESLPSSPRRFSGMGGSVMRGTPSRDGKPARVMTPGSPAAMLSTATT